MPKMFISKKIQINAPMDKVMGALNDFHHWPKWSPWLIAEPEAIVTTAEDGKSYDWKGSRTGEGEMKVVKESNDKIDFDLTFIKPWKSKAKTGFKLSEINGGTQTEWTMDSSLPFFMFFMKNKMEAAVGMDYERGLKMLKDYVEKGHVDSRLEFVGENTLEGGTYIGIRTKTSFENIGKAMESDFMQLGAFVKENGIEASGMPFSIYEKFDIVPRKIDYVAAIPVKSAPASLSGKLFSAELPTSRVHTVRHHGTYEHLGNAWAASIMMERNKEFKSKKGTYPMEFYVNDPNDVSPSELITDVSFVLG